MLKIHQRGQHIPSFDAVVSACLRPPRFDASQELSPYGIVGLSALYTSAYYLPLLTPVRAYLLPSTNLLRLIVVPSLVGAITFGAAIFLGSILARKWCPPSVCAAGAYFAVSFLTLMGFNGVLEAAGYQWQELIPVGGNLLNTERYFKVLALCVVLGLVWMLRDALPQIGRLLGMLGFAFATLATVRIGVIVERGEPAVGAVRGSPTQSSSIDPQSLQNRQVGAKPHSRRVVWIIFDELDYRRIFTDREPGLDLPHFDWLARRSVNAINANSPANATLYSVPALLTGIPLGGNGVHIAKPASLVIETSDATNLPFSQENTIFGKLESSAKNVSILGFYHPYCKLFTVQKCVSFPYYEVGGIWTALWAILPERFVSRVIGGNLMERTTIRSLEILPEFLARDDELTFVHLNVPHLPASFADRIWHLRETERGEVEYSRNLRLTDEILGTVIAELQRQEARHELLLVVSTDHWFRNIWFQPRVKETSRSVPFMAWRVGETEGESMNEPVSTVNTAAMIEDFLQGGIDSQASIAEWWARQRSYPSLIVTR